MHLENIDENARGINLHQKLVKEHFKTKNRPLTKEEKAIKKIKKKIELEEERNGELNTWGMNNHVIGMTLKIRTLEDLIDCAQRCQIKPNKEIE